MPSRFHQKHFGMRRCAASVLCHHVPLRSGELTARSRPDRGHPLPKCIDNVTEKSMAFRVAVTCSLLENCPSARPMLNVHMHSNCCRGFKRAPFGRHLNLLKPPSGGAARPLINQPFVRENTLECQYHSKEQRRMQTENESLSCFFF